MAILRLDDDFAAAVLKSAGLDPTTHDISTMEVSYAAGADKATVRVVQIFEVDSSALRILVKTAATDQFKGNVPALQDIETRLDQIKEEATVDVGPVRGPVRTDIPVAEVVKGQGKG